MSKLSKIKEKSEVSQKTKSNTFAKTRKQKNQLLEILQKRVKLTKNVKKF